MKITVFLIDDHMRKNEVWVTFIIVKQTRQDYKLLKILCKNQDGNIIRDEGHIKKRFVWYFWKLKSYKTPETHRIIAEFFKKEETELIILRGKLVLYIKCTKKATMSEN